MNAGNLLVYVWMPDVWTHRVVSCVNVYLGTHMPLTEWTVEVSYEHWVFISGEHFKNVELSF